MPEDLTFQNHPPIFSEQGPDKDYAAFLAAGEFRIQHCSACAEHVFYPRAVCPHCGATALEWVVPSGKGVVYSTSVPRGGKEGDYNISLVDLHEGPRLLSRVVDIAPEAVVIGMPVEAFIGELNGKALVLFRPQRNDQQ